jgi:hypothetical protein
VREIDTYIERERDPILEHHGLHQVFVTFGRESSKMSSHCWARFQFFGEPRKDTRASLRALNRGIGFKSKLQ